MMDKKVTRKDFLLSVLSITALFVASKVPQVIKKGITIREKNSYGNYSYGGNKKNA